MKYTARDSTGATVRATARGTYSRDCSVVVEAIQ